MKPSISDDRLKWLLRLLVVVGTVYALAAIVVLLALQQWREFGETAFALLMVPIMVAVVWVGVSAEPRNRLVWVLLTWFLIIGTYPVSIAVRLILEPDVPTVLDIETQIPAELPPTVAWIEGLPSGLGSLGLLLLLTFGVLLFPNGRLPSPRWRWVARVFAVCVVLFAAINFWLWNPTMTVAPATHPLFHLSTPVVLGGPLTAIASLAVRYRRSHREVRARIRWILWGGMVAIPLILVSMVLGDDVLDTVGFLVFFGSYGIAIVRHNLFDVDVVISRTLVYGLLAGLIGVVYVSIVVGIGSLIGSGDEPNTALVIAANAVVAVAFQPARRRLQRVANRIVYGRRATPYQVLADFSHRVAATGDTLPTDAARFLVDGTGAERAVITTRVGVASVEIAKWPPSEESAGRRELVVLDFPITEEDTILGTLEIHLAPGVSLAADERRLAERVAAGMGLALTNQTLTERLITRVDELRESRRRLVAVQDETRRRLERDLHDGAQQQLVALKVKLGLCRTMARSSGRSEIMNDLERLGDEADRAVNALRNFARGVYPALLEAEGLEAALTARVRRSDFAVTIESEELGRYPREIESTIDFCVLEALAAPATPAARVGLAQRNGSLTFCVQQNPGADPQPDLTRMTDRLDALSGTLDVRVDQADGITMTGSVPVGRSQP